MTIGDDTIVSYVDESCKPVRDRATGKVIVDQRYYVAAAAVTFAGDRGDLRDQLDVLRAEVGVPLHYSDLGVARRTDVLKRIADLKDWEAHLFETAEPITHGTSEHYVRAKIMGDAFKYLNKRVGATGIVLESRGKPGSGFEGLDKKDHDVLNRLRRHNQVGRDLLVRHDEKSETLLTLADLVAGARTDALCAVNATQYALISHRIACIRQIEI